MLNQRTSGALAGRSVLIVEDEYYLADDLRAEFAGQGADIVGLAGNMAEADRMVAEGGFDCAVLDMNLHGDTTERLADRLTEAGVPFLFVSGYCVNSLPERLRHVPHLEKPADAGSIAEALARLPSVAGR